MFVDPQSGKAIPGSTVELGTIAPDPPPVGEAIGQAAARVGPSVAREVGPVDAVKKVPKIVWVGLGLGAAFLVYQLWRDRA